MIHVRDLEAADVHEIHAWPAYVGELAALDYALRPGGWLDMFPASPGTHHFAMMDGGALVGFTMLVGTSDEEAEFYIAVHPEKTGQGVGRVATERTLELAFTRFQLRSVHLKVRTWHQRGIALYGDVGFQRIGEKEEEVRGQPVRFVLMRIDRPRTVGP